MVAALPDVGESAADCSRPGQPSLAHGLTPSGPRRARSYCLERVWRSPPFHPAALVGVLAVVFAYVCRSGGWALQHDATIAMTPRKPERRCRCSRREASQAFWGDESLGRQRDNPRHRRPIAVLEGVRSRYPIGAQLPANRATTVPSDQFPNLSGIRVASSGRASSSN